MTGRLLAQDFEMVLPETLLQLMTGAHSFALTVIQLLSLIAVQVEQPIGRAQRTKYVFTVGRLGKL